MESTSTPVQMLRTHLADVDQLDSPGAAGALQEVRAIRGFLDAYEARLTRHISALHRAGESAPPADLHTRDGGVSSKEAKQKQRRAEALEAAPALAERLEAGEATAAHADALANLTGRLDDATRAAFFEHEELIAADATRRTPEEFARNCRDLIRSLERDQGVERDRRQRRDTRLTTTVDRDGMYVLNGRFHPELGHAIFTAIDAETGKLVKAAGDRSVDRAAVAADALGNLVSGGHQAERPHHTEILLLIDEHTVVNGIHDHTVCEYGDGTPIPVTNVQRFVCDAHIVPVIRRPDGTIVDLGRTQRLANRTQRRALRAMYPTCAFHGCDIPFARCEIHHIIEYELGGVTDLANLLPLCPRHHHVIHDLNWRLELDQHRTLTIRDHHGQIHAIVPLPTAPTQPLAAPTPDRDRPPDPIHGTSPPPDPIPGQPDERPPDQLQLTS